MEKVQDAQLPSEIDIFFVAAGADYRAYENLRRLNSAGCRIGQLVVYDFHQRRKPDDGDYMEKYEAFHAVAANQRTVVDVDIADPASCVTSLISAGITVRPDVTVALDISCFTKPFFYVLLKYLAKKRVGQRVDVLHATARISIRRRALQVIPI